MKKYQILFVLILSAAVLLSSCSKTTAPADNNSSVETESQTQTQTTVDRFKTKAIDFELEAFNGEKVKLSSLKGKLVVVNFFTTWCKYCKLEMPGFVDAMKKLSSTNKIKFLFIDVSENKGDLSSFLKQNKLEAINPLMDTSGAVFTAYGAAGFPSTFIIDKDGRVAYHQDGEMEEAFLLQQIDNALK